MQWYCPACRTEIHHNADAQPQPDRRYHCELCALELIYDGQLRAMRLTSLDTRQTNRRSSVRFFPAFDRRLRPRRRSDLDAYQPA